MRHIHKISKDKEVILLMDTTYWGRSFGLLVIKDAYRNKVLWYKFVHHETISDYKEGIEYLRDQGFSIYGIVCDGMRGLFKEFRHYPIQMCQFHMIMIVRRYLTETPDLQASKELLALTNQLSKLSKDEFFTALEDWYIRWCDFLKERSVDVSTKRTYYTHKRVRSAFLSLKYYTPYLWTFEKYHSFRIPNTNAGIESLFANLKKLLRIHSGISKERRKKLIQEYIARHF